MSVDVTSGRCIIWYTEHLKEPTMNDFNLRPEIMGFGRPERALATPAPTLLPADQWKPHGKSFEVNGLGQLRTALALPASDAEIVASMRHADAAPVAHTDSCACDGCTASSLGGRFSNPTKIMAQTPRLSTSQAASNIASAAKSPTVGEALKMELQSMIVKLVGKESRDHVRGVLREFNGANNLREVPFRRYAELKARLQADLDIPF